MWRLRWASDYAPHEAVACEEFAGGLAQAVEFGQGDDFFVGSDLEDVAGN